MRTTHFHGKRLIKEDLSMKKILFSTLLFSFFLGVTQQTFAFSRGIYLTQSTEQNTTKLNSLIQQAKKYHLDTFVVDINYPNKQYAANIKAILANGIHYVARVVIFPHGGTHIQITDKAIWAKRLKLAIYAAQLGASAIQLDYIRYRSAFPADPQKAKRVLTVVQYYKNALKPYNVSLQMDIFGIAAHRPAHTIGHDPKSLASVIDAFCPMVYPSHFEPYREHAIRPYETIFNAVKALKKQIVGQKPVDIFAYIELFNYRYKMSHEARLRYIAAQIKAAHDSGANGWYAWTATNHYRPLLEVLATGKA